MEYAIALLIVALCGCANYFFYSVTRSTTRNTMPKEIAIPLDREREVQQAYKRRYPFLNRALILAMLVVCLGLIVNIMSDHPAAPGALLAVAGVTLVLSIYKLRVTQRLRKDLHGL